MATIKSYTDIEQSKKLAEILPLESADMLHCLSFDRDLLATVPKQYSGSFRHQPELTIPCWSLASLLGVLPYYPTLHRTISGWRCDIYNEKGHISQFGEKSDNPVDACYEMILKLNELKML